MDPSDPRIPCLPQLKEMLAQGGKVRDTPEILPWYYIWRNLSEVSLRIWYEKRPGVGSNLGNTIVFWDEHTFTPSVHRFEGTHSHFPPDCSEAKECLAAAQTQKKSVEEILGASKDWDLDLTKMAMAAMGQNWKPADGIKDFLSISSIIVLANDWGIPFWPDITLLPDGQCTTQKWGPKTLVTTQTTQVLPMAIHLTLKALLTSNKLRANSEIFQVCFVVWVVWVFPSLSLHFLLPTEPGPSPERVRSKPSILIATPGPLAAALEDGIQLAHWGGALHLFLGIFFSRSFLF